MKFAKNKFIKLKIHILISSIQEQRLKCESFFKHVYKQEQRKHVYNRANAAKFNCSRSQLFHVKLLVSSSIACEIIDNANSFI